MIRRLASAAGALAWPAGLFAGSSGSPGLGLTPASFAIRHRLARKGPVDPPLRNSLDFLELAHDLGAGGIQASVNDWISNDISRRLRERCETWGLYLEGQIGLPDGPEGGERFEALVREAKIAGAAILRVAILSGRRYESFNTAAGFREFQARSRQALHVAEPVARRHGCRLAIENHKDWRVPDLLAILQELDSEYVGVCLDTGNSISLLENPMQVVEAYAPYALTTHFKDMAVREYSDGFRLAEVPLGNGFLDLKQIVAVLARANPKIRFNLEMITRDPLDVPCLTPKYWATFPKLPGRHLADSLAMVRREQPTDPLPRISQLSPEKQLEAEMLNVQDSLRYAHQYLGL